MHAALFGALRPAKRVLLTDARARARAPQLPATEPPAMSILACPRCGCALLAADFLHGRVRTMEDALRHHHSGACVDPRRQASLRWPGGEPALVHAARTDPDRAAELLASAVDVDAEGRCGVTALHLAAATDATALVGALLDAGADATRPTHDDAHAGLAGGRTPLHAAANAGAAAAAAALCEAAPAAAASADWDGVWPFELAWLAGAQPLAERLAQAALDFVGDGDGDGDGDIPRAELRERARAVCDGAATASDLQHARTMRKLELRERRRDALHIDCRPALHVAQLLRGAWSASACEAMLVEARGAAALHGWSTGRHRHHATTDLPLWRAPLAHERVRAALRAEILPAMGAAFGIPPASLTLREAFIACYDGRSGRQSGLGMHRDGTPTPYAARPRPRSRLLPTSPSLPIPPHLSPYLPIPPHPPRSLTGTLLSCSWLLNGEAEFDGGGTAFAAPLVLREWEDGAWRREAWAGGGEGGGAEGGGEDGGTHVVGGRRGDVLLHCGQLRHGAAPVTRGTRYLLVCFVDELRDASTAQLPASEPAAGPATPQSAVGDRSRREGRSGALASPRAAGGGGKRSSLIKFAGLEEVEGAGGSVPERRAKYRDTPLRRLPPAPAGLSPDDA